MRSSKIKNIIILMLLLVNAFLLVLVGGRSWHSRQTLRETGERMVVILERNGVEFLPRENWNCRPAGSRPCLWTGRGPLCCWDR